MSGDLWYKYQGVLAVDSPFAFGDFSLSLLRIHATPPTLSLTPPPHSHSTMRSFGLSVFATLALAAFSYAAPMVAGVNAIAARHEDHTKSVSLEVVLTTAIELVTPITNELGKRYPV